jgi:hypothetical protein
LTEWLSLGTPPTRAEIRAFRISVSDEAVPRLRQIYRCPGCGDLHPELLGPLAIFFPMIEEGYAALREAALESVREKRQLSGEVRDLRAIVDELTSLVNEQRKEIENLRRRIRT